MELDVVNFLIGFVVLVCTTIFLIANYPKIEAILNNKLSDSLDRDLEDKSAEPLHDIFLGFEHATTMDWIQWLETQDKEFQNAAYQKIVDYLTREPEQLGSVTGDAVKALVAMKKENTYQIIKDLLVKVREKFHRFKSIDIFYQDAAALLIKMDEVEAVNFLNKEIEQYIGKLDGDKVQGYIVRALLTCANDELITPILAEVISNSVIKRNIKVEVLFSIEHKDTQRRKEVYKIFFDKFLKLGAESLSDDDQFVVEQMFGNIKIFLVEENHDEQLWQTILDICEVAKLRTLFIKLLSEFLENSEKPMSQQQILSLLNKPEPARSNFKEALVKRHQVTDKELEVLKIPVKVEDLFFEKNIITLEKSKKTKTIVHELLDTYHFMEKIISSNESAKSDKHGLIGINLIAGDAKFEKEYLLRTIAANTNRSFIYVDFDKILKVNFEVTNLKNMSTNCKPCIVYFDNMVEILSLPELGKAEALHLKELNKVIGELGVIPSIFFCGNLPYKRESLQEFHPELYDVIHSPIKGNYKFCFSIDNPDDQQRMLILQKYQSKISEARIAKSPEYDAQTMLTLTSSKTMLEYLLFLHSYFQFSLLVAGTLIDVNKFQNEIAFSMVPDLYDLSKAAPELEEAVQ